VRTSVIYDVDGVAERLGPDVVGFERRQHSLEAMRESAAVHFVKTHRQRDHDVDESDQAVCLVRDGRDSLVSWARLECEKPGREFRTELERMIKRDARRGAGSWGSNVLSWVRPPVPQRVVLRYEDLVGDPAGSLRRVLTDLALPLSEVEDREAPAFAELHHVDPKFFRRGRTGSHGDELPADLHDLFWSRPDNVAAMALLGYGLAGSHYDAS
jgi:Sulfotransferase domain